MVYSSVGHLIDDIDGTDAQKTVRFALDGWEYEIDLSRANAAELYAIFAAYAPKARIIRGARRHLKSR